MGEIVKCSKMSVDRVRVYGHGVECCMARQTECRGDDETMR